MTRWLLVLLVCERCAQLFDGAMTTKHFVTVELLQVEAFLRQLMMKAMTKTMGPVLVSLLMVRTMGRMVGTMEVDMVSFVERTLERNQCKCEG